MKTRTLLLAAAIAAFTLVQMGCTPEETASVTPGGSPLTSVPGQDQVIPTSLVGTEWVMHEEWVSPYNGMQYEMIQDEFLRFETDSTGVREIQGYPSSNVPEEWSIGPLPFTYTYDPETGICDYNNIPGNNSFVYVYDNVQDALVGVDNSRVYFRVQ